MIYGMYSSAFGGKIEMTRADVIANNMANMDTPGFRKDFISFRERLSEANLKMIGPELSDKKQDVLTEGPVIYTTSFEKENAASKYSQTNESLHVAIEGDGYFMVRENDRIYYTREGDFMLDSEGFICMPGGNARLLNLDAEEIQLTSTNNLEITSEGDIYSNNTGIGRMAIMNFSDPQNLKKLGNSLLEYTGSDEVLPAQRFNVQQGFVELSSVNPVEEMKDMIETNRLFEGNMRLIAIQNETLDKAANNIGRIPS